MGEMPRFRTRSTVEGRPLPRRSVAGKKRLCPKRSAAEKGPAPYGVRDLRESKNLPSARKVKGWGPRVEGLRLLSIAYSSLTKREALPLLGRR